MALSSSTDNAFAAETAPYNSHTSTQGVWQRLHQWWQHQWDLVLLWGCAALLVANLAWALWPISQTQVVWLSRQTITQYPARPLPEAILPLENAEFSDQSNTSRAESSATKPKKATHRPAYTAKPKPRGPVNINSASTAQLQTLPGIGPAMAGRILAYRQQHGPFNTPNDLLPIKGIGPKTLEKLKPYLKF